MRPLPLARDAPVAIRPAPRRPSLGPLRDSLPRPEGVARVNIDAADPAEDALPAPATEAVPSDPALSALSPRLVPRLVPLLGDVG